MRKLFLIGFYAGLCAPLASILGPLNAWGSAGDDAFKDYCNMNYPRAFESARPAAEEGDFLAQFILGRIYQEGNGAPQDKTEAGKWFNLALIQAKPLAMKGDPRAQYALGRMYAEGWALPQDYDQAFLWYQKAAGRGNHCAQSNIGWMNENGHGVPQDYKKAVAWYRKAAEQGHADVPKPLKNPGVTYGIKRARPLN